MHTVVAKGAVVRWKIAIFAIFFSSGFATATWASRVPAIKAALGVDNLHIGLLLLGGGVGALIGISLATYLSARFGTRASLPVTIIVFAVGVILVGVATDLVPSYGVVLIGLFLFGIGNGSTDVMMNVEGAAIETHTRKTLLPMFHGLFSLGTVAGAAFGALAIRLSLSVAAHTAIVALVVIAIALATPANIPVRDHVTTRGTSQSPATDGSVTDNVGARTRAPWRRRLSIALEAYKDPRTYGIGLVMLGMSFAEGGANDWLALAMVDEHGQTEALGAMALATFSVSMTVVRLLGGPVVDRFGRVATLRVLALLATTGLALFIVAPSTPVMFIAAALWGAGVSLGFPLGMSAAADDPARAAARVSAVATIGYVAFLGGPPLLGFVSEHIGLLATLWVLVGLAAISGLASSAVRESKPGQHARQ